MPTRRTSTTCAKARPSSSSSCWKDAGAEAAYHDPFIAVIPPTREHATLTNRKSVPVGPGEIAGYDAVLIATDHDGVDYGALAANAKLLVDTRNVCERLGIAGPNIVKA